MQAANRIFLELCVGIERLSADLYCHYGRIFGDRPEAALLWKKAAIQKENQQRLYELALRLLHEIEFHVSGESLKRASLIQYRLLGFIADCGNESPQLMAAVTTAVELELELAELHAHAALHFRDESLARLFRALDGVGRYYVAELQRRHADRNPPFLQE